MTPTFLVDSHCHLNRIDLSLFRNEMPTLLAEAKQAGVGKFLCVCVELEDVPVLQALATDYPDIYTSVGIHPNTVLERELSKAELISLAKHPSCIAVGETGLDYYRTEEKASQLIQQERFQTHIQAARELEKPLIIHTRSAPEDTLSMMRESGADQIGGVMHCFCEDWDVARRALDLNFYISFSGIVTFKNAQVLQDVAKKVPADRFLIETDAPYLAPVPYRGKENHPALVRYVAEKLSELRGIHFEEIAQQSTENFYRCFRLNKPEEIELPL